MPPSFWIEVVLTTVGTFVSYFLFARVLPRLASKTDSNIDDFVFISLSKYTFPIGVTLLIYLTE